MPKLETPPAWQTNMLLRRNFKRFPTHKKASICFNTLWADAGHSRTG